MVSPEDSSGSPGSHRSASLTGTEEAADLRVWAAVAREHAWHVSCSETILTCHSRCMAAFTDSAGCRSQHLLPAASPIHCGARWQLWQCHMAAAGRVGLLVVPTPADRSSWRSA